MSSAEAIQRLCRERRDRFEAWSSKTDDVFKKADYEWAIELTDKALAASQELDAAIAREATAHDAWIAERTEIYRRREERQRGTEAEPKSSKGKSSKSAGNDEPRRFAEDMTEDWRQERLDLVPRLQRELLERALRPETDVQQEALIEGVKLVVTNTPVAGPFLDLADTVNELAKRVENDAEAAARHSKYVDDYCTALEFWCSAADATTERIDKWADTYL